jgi:hypothetical protein
MSNTIISYPVPAYQNVPIQPDFYAPRRFAISAITLGQPTTIASTEIMNFNVGQLIRLIIPNAYGAHQLNDALGYVLNIPSVNQVVVNIDSSVGVNPFVLATNQTVVAQILPVGDINSGVITNTGRTNNQTFINGSFINVS